MSDEIEVGNFFEEPDYLDQDESGEPEMDLREYQLAYCASNFDISSCERYSHFNQPFFKTILILRKFNIDILDILVISLLVNLLFAKHLCDILEKPLISVIRHYKLYIHPHLAQVKRDIKLPKKLSSSLKFSKKDETLLRVNNDASKGKHERNQSLSGISTCDSEKQASLTTETPDSIPGSDETIRNIEKWAFNLTKFALSGASKNRQKVIISDWLNALNEQSRKLSSASSRNGYTISFENINEKSRTPKVTKLRAEITQNGSMCVIGHLEAKKLIFDVKFEPNKSPKSQTKSITVEKLMGELILTPSRDTFGHYRLCASFMGRPQVAKVTYYQEKDLMQSEATADIINNQELTLLVYQCIASMTVDINLSSCNSVPESVIGGSGNQSLASKVEEMIETIKKETTKDNNKGYSGNSASMGKERDGNLPMPMPRIRTADRRLLVKVIKASITSSGSLESGVYNPYCVLETDFPSQKHRTNTIHSTNEPFWDEHFLFDYGRRTKTLWVTVYDRDQTQDKNILGQCQIDLQDHRKINLSWQTFKLENPYSPGSLQYATITLELMFVGQSTADRHPLHSAGASAFPPANRNSLQISLNDPEISGSQQNSLRSNTSVTFNMIPAPDPPNPGKRSAFSPIRRGRSRNKSASPKRERSRSRTSDSSGPAKAIKDWFSRRDRSVDLSSSNHGHGVADASGHHQPLIVRLRSKEALNPPTQALFPVTSANDPPQISPTGQSASHTAPASSDTSSINSRNSFVNYDCSTLVIESQIENKYYLISKELAKSGKHGLKGNKLHIYNDHTFTATHFTRSETCEVCLKPISKRLGLGKQGYKCRDCEYTCHKGCHYKTELICANSRVSLMEMEFVGEAQLVFQESPDSEINKRKGSNNSAVSPVY